MSECEQTFHNDHDKPDGYAAREAWATNKLKTHTQHQCPECGLWAVWKPREKRDELFQKVKAHMNWSDEKTKIWFHTENPLFGDMKPYALLALRPEKAARLIEALIAGEGACVYPTGP